MGKYDLQRLRDLHALPAMTDYLRQSYPKMDKPLLSKAMNEGYGVQLKPEALKSLAQEFDPEGWESRRSKDRHKRKNSARCRLTDEESEAFAAAWQSAGYKTANACVHDLILKFLREREMIRDLLEEERAEREKQFWDYVDKEGGIH